MPGMMVPRVVDRRARAMDAFCAAFVSRRFFWNWSRLSAPDAEGRGPPAAPSASDASESAGDGDRLAAAPPRARTDARARAFVGRRPRGWSVSAGGGAAAAAASAAARGASAAGGWGVSAGLRRFGDAGSSDAPKTPSRHAAWSQPCWDAA